MSHFVIRHLDVCSHEFYILHLSRYINPIPWQAPLKYQGEDFSQNNSQLALIPHIYTVYYNLKLPLFLDLYTIHVVKFYIKIEAKQSSYININKIAIGLILMRKLSFIPAVVSTITTTFDGKKLRFIMLLCGLLGPMNIFLSY